MEIKSRNMEVDNGAVIDCEVTVNCFGKSKSFSFSTDAKLGEVRTGAAVEFNDKNEASTRLILNGAELLDDEKSLRDHGISDGTTIYMVFKRSFDTKFKEDGEAAPFDFATGVNPFQFANYGFDAAGCFADMQRRMQLELIRKPELRNALHRSPLSRRLAAEPRLLRHLLLSHPQLPDLLPRHPALRAALTTDGPTGGASVATMLSEYSRAMCRERPLDNAAEWAASSPLARRTPGLVASLSQLAAAPGLLARVLAAPYVRALLDGLEASPHTAHAYVLDSPVYSASTHWPTPAMLPAFFRQMKTTEAADWTAERLRTRLQVEESAAAVLPRPERATAYPAHIGSHYTELNRLLWSLVEFCAQIEAAPGGVGGAEGGEGAPQLLTVGATGEAEFAVVTAAAFDGQLARLREMGFGDAKEIADSLSASFGNINEAVSKLLPAGESAPLAEAME